MRTKIPFLLLALLALAGCLRKEYAEKEDEPAEEVYSLVPEEGEETTTFCIDDEGCIIWKDAIENAGEGLRFLPSNG